MHDLVIESFSLRKEYGDNVAVADLTLAVPRGEVFAFLGPNGAGKSTSVKMMLGLVGPSGGQVRVLGLPPGAPVAMARIGFLPEHFRFHPWLQAAELLDLHGRLYGMERTVRTQRIPQVLELVGLAEHTRRPLSAFSKGMLQRIGLAQALLNDPELVFLDEPTSALDPFGRMLVRGIIHDLKARGTTVFLNSHLLGEVEVTADRAAFIRAGRVLRTVALRDLEAGQIRVELRIGGTTPALLHALDELCIERRILDPLPMAGESSSPQDTPAVAVAGVAVTMLELVVADEETLPAIAERVLASGARLYALSPRRMSLEQLFLDIVGSQDSGQ